MIALGMIFLGLANYKGIIGQNETKIGIYGSKMCNKFKKMAEILSLSILDAFLYYHLVVKKGTVFQKKQTLFHQFYTRLEQFRQV